jgi:alcohol dehydrogenase class IV
MPPFITAGTGMDALAHCLEAYCAPGFHPMADGIAVEGVRLVFENLPKAFANGKDITARANMMAAAAMGATAFQKGLGAIHSLSHPIGGLYDTHHGMTNAVFMPYVLGVQSRCHRGARSTPCGLLRHQGRLRRFPESGHEAAQGTESAAHAAGLHQRPGDRTRSGKR